MREILNAKGPKDKRVQAKFLSFGRGPNKEVRLDDSLNEYISTHKDDWGKSLVVTDVVESQSTVYNIINLLKGAGYYDFDIACLYKVKLPENEDLKSGQTEEFYVQTKDGQTKKQNMFIGLKESEPRLASVGRQGLKTITGVEKKRRQSSGKTAIVGAFPQRLIDKDPNMSEEEKVKTQNMVNQGREDAKLIAQEVVNKVWGKAEGQKD